ncbi:gem-associated protein 7-like isoform X2 [Oratosquilla oratoria]|uniref:gem-associated protein 7-like isoform X2 n=1 Tax=Oratosquilla oratoria TaxID=337810 RepID=UPI003F76332C
MEGEPMDAEDVDHTEAAQQKCRAKLRERFLWAVTRLNGQQATISMTDGLQVSGMFRGIDRDVLHMHIQDLQTPVGQYKWATLRIPDCLDIEMNVKGDLS